MICHQISIPSLICINHASLYLSLGNAWICHTNLPYYLRPISKLKLHLVCTSCKPFPMYMETTFPMCNRLKSPKNNEEWGDNLTPNSLHTSCNQLVHVAQTKSELYVFPYKNTDRSYLSEGESSPIQFQVHLGFC